MSIFIKNGTVVNHDWEGKADVLIEGNTISAVGSGLTPPDGARIIDAEGKLVIPGGIDTHTHCQLPFMGTFAVDDFEYGTRAAVAGGTTCLIDFVIPSKGQSLLENYKQWREWADAAVACDYALHVAVTWYDGRGGQVEKELEELATTCGVSSLKVFMAYEGVFMLDDGEIYEVMKVAKRLGMMTMVHAENGKMVTKGVEEMHKAGVFGPEGHPMSRPEEVEEEATKRVLMIGNRVNTPTYIVHVNSAMAASQIGEAKRKNWRSYGEVIAAGLGVDGTHCWHHDFSHACRYIMGPPLREDPNTKVLLMDALASGVLDTVGTDNCTFTGEQKALGKDDFAKIPNGVNGIEDRMSIVFTKGVKKGKLTYKQFVHATSFRATQLFNLPTKGKIAVGYDADVVVWDPHAERTISYKTHHHHPKLDFNIFEGMKVFGVADVTISRGAVVWENGTLATTKGHGKFVHRPTHGVPFDGIEQRDEERDVKKRRVDRKPYTGPVWSPSK